MSTLVLEELLSAARSGGVTYNVAQGEVVTQLDEWCFPRWPDRTEIVQDNRLEAALAVYMQRYNDALLSEDVLLGVWRDDGRYYIDMNVHVPRFEDAKRLADRYGRESKRSIISAYNPAKKETRYF